MSFELSVHAVNCIDGMFSRPKMWAISAPEFEAVLRTYWEFAAWHVEFTKDDCGDYSPNWINAMSTFSKGRKLSASVPVSSQLDFDGTVEHLKKFWQLYRPRVLESFKTHLTKLQNDPVGYW